MVYKIRTKLPQAVFRMIYFAFVLILYGIEVHANTTPNHLSKQLRHSEYVQGSAFHASSYGQLWPNVTPSIKPEAHNVSQCRQRRTEPRPQGIYTKNREDRSSGSRDARGQTYHTDRSAHRQTKWSQYSPTGVQ